MTTPPPLLASLLRASAGDCDEGENNAWEAHEWADHAAMLRQAATALEALAAERDALREALAECRRAVSGGKSNPRQTVRNIVDMAIEERGRCATLERTPQP